MVDSENWSAKEMRWGIEKGYRRMSLEEQQRSRTLWKLPDGNSIIDLGSHVRLNSISL